MMRLPACAACRGEFVPGEDRVPRPVQGPWECPARVGGLGKWRRERDSNPRDVISAYTISNRAPSTARTPLRETACQPSPSAHDTSEHGEAGGEGGIRTLDTLAGITVFETAAFDHSATSPPLLLHELTGLGQAGGGALATDLATDWLLGAWLPAGHRFAFGRRIPTRRQLPRRDD